MNNKTIQYINNCLSKALSCRWGNVMPNSQMLLSLKETSFNVVDDGTFSLVFSLVDTNGIMRGFCSFITPVYEDKVFGIKFSAVHESSHLATSHNLRELVMEINNRMIYWKTPGAYMLNQGNDICYIFDMYLDDILGLPDQINNILKWVFTAEASIYYIDVGEYGF